MDQTNFNIHISRNEGRSKRGTRCTTVAAGSRGSNVHIIGAISNMGFIHHQLKRGSFKKVNAIEWIKDCLRLSMSKHGGPVVLVLDNAPCHSNVEEHVLVGELEACKILRLGPYSPMLNPIENVWSVLKSSVKSKLSSQMAQILAPNSNNLTIKEHRLRMLEIIVQEAIPSITPDLCVSCIASIQRRFSSALSLEDMMF